MRIDFCFPVKNEEKILKPNIEKVYNFLISKGYNFDWKIILILNGCTDNSEKIITDLSATKSGLIEHFSITPSGKGGALKYYFSKSRADILVFMDIDLAVSLENLDLLIDPILNNQADLVIGSRLLKKSKVERSYFRSLSSLVYNQLSRLLLNHDFRDLQCGFKSLKPEVFLKVEPSLKDNNWFFDTELVILAKKYKFRIFEIPVDWTENRYAQRVSKVSVYKHAWGFIKNSIALRFRLSKIK